MSPNEEWFIGSRIKSVHNFKGAVKSPKSGFYEKNMPKSIVVFLKGKLTSGESRNYSTSVDS